MLKQCVVDTDRDVEEISTITLIRNLQRGHVSLPDGGRAKNLQYDQYFSTPTDPVPPEGDPSEDAPVSRGKLCSYLQI